VLYVVADVKICALWIVKHGSNHSLHIDYPHSIV